MDIDNINRREDSVANPQLNKSYEKLESLVDALRKKEFSNEGKIVINEHLKGINSFSGSEKELIRELKRTYKSIVKFSEEVLHFLLKHHYRSLGLVFGMMGGLLLSSVSDSFGILNFEPNLGAGMAIGMAIGMVIGEKMDRKVAKEGSQLDV
jgi:hypothetical protein